jgi:sugar lactone lactonase YvrE
MHKELTMRLSATAVLAGLCGLLLAAPALAKDHGTSRIPLPDGFHPEGIVGGPGNTLYVAQFETGAVFKLDARSGEGAVLVPPQPGRAGIGIKLDRRTSRLFVAGGGTGHAFVYDAATGASLADFTLASGTTFVNDLIITRDAVYFTDSFQPVLYKLPLGPHGELPAPGAVTTIPLAGDYQHVPGAFNANGIEATPCGRTLLVVNGANGVLYRVDPATGNATAVTLAGGDLVNGDGLVLRGHTLIVVENFSSQVVVVDLAPDLGSGTITRTITSPDLDIPATGALLGNTLYVTNARFTTPVTPTTPYWITRIPLH